MPTNGVGLGHAQRLGLGAEQILVEDMVLLTTIIGMLAHTFDPWLARLAVGVAIPTVVAALLPHRAPLLLGVIGLAAATLFIIRRFVNRHLHPAAVVRPCESHPAAAGLRPFLPAHERRRATER